MNNFLRSHFLTVFFSLKRYFWVLLLPVVRTVLAFGFDYQNAFKGYEADITILSVLFLYALSRWTSTFLMIGENNVSFKKGVFFKKSITVRDENISCIKLWSNPFSVIFSCFILKVYENPSKKPIISIYVTKNTAEKIKEKYFPDEKSFSSYRSKPFLYALVFGNNKGGFLLVSALFSFSGIITGRTIRKLAQDNLSAISGYLQDIPSFLLFIGIALIVIRTISLFLEAASVSYMKIREQKDSILIKRGFFKKILCRINVKKENIGYILQTESIFLKNIYSMYIGLVGFGEGRYDSSLLFPIAYKNGKDHPENAVRSPARAISSYITKWIVISAVSLFACITALIIGLSLIFFIIFLFSALVSLFFIFLNVNKWRYSYISVSGENIEVCQLQGVKKYKYIAERKKCCKIQIKQNIFQKRRDIADLCLYLRGFNNKKVRIRHIEMGKCMEISEMR